MLQSHFNFSISGETYERKWDSSLLRLLYVCSLSAATSLANDMLLVEEVQSLNTKTVFLTIGFKSENSYILLPINISTSIAGKMAFPPIMPGSV